MTRRCAYNSALTVAMALSLASCAGGAFTGPVEVTRFVAEQPAGLGEGRIELRFSDEITNLSARDAFRAAISNELGLLGYTVVGAGGLAGQVATAETSRSAITPSKGRDPVNVGVSGQTGSYGSGLGLGVGINLGGSSREASVISRLSIRISTADGTSLWEGRASQPISIDSPYAPTDISARTLAKALFRDFPGGNGKTVIIDVDDLQD